MAYGILLTISILLRKFNRTVTRTTVITVVCVLGVTTLQFIVQSRAESGFSPQTFGGPAFDAENVVEAKYAALVLNASPEGGASLGVNNAVMDSFAAPNEGAFRTSASPLGGLAGSKEGALTYTVQRGDTLASIAKDFGVSLNTVLWANEGLGTGRFLQPGQNISILPVSGVLHRAAEGETIASIASLYGVPANDITGANPALSSGGGPKTGEGIVIPGGRPLRVGSSLYSASALPDLRGYFILPVKGVNWGELHPRNAVDIANACGTPIIAAAEGLVTEVGNPGSWNGGYGGFVEIEHPNQTATRYAHLGKSYASVGDYVKQGETIAEIGNTGNAHGPTGCHLHFEVEGAKNPFAK